EGAERNEEPAEIDLDKLEEGNGKLRGERSLTDFSDNGGSDQGRGALDNDLDAATKAFGRLLVHLEIIVIQADCAINEREQEDNPDIRIAQIAPQENGHGYAGQDHQPAHGRGALLLQQMTLGTLFPDRLALALTNAQGLDDVRPEQEHKQKR